jgi:RNA polymerase sigma-70 factor (ECF subfamily)
MKNRGSTDEAAFDAFVRASSQRLLAQSYVVTGNSTVAQDLTQEALLRAWIHWSRVSKYESPEAWTSRVLHNLGVSKVRRDKRTPTFLRASETLNPPVEEHLILAAALRSLPRDQARALVLHDGAGVSISEVAQQMQAPEGTVKSWISRGRASAAKLLSDPNQSTVERHANR